MAPSIASRAVGFSKTRLIERSRTRALLRSLAYYLPTVVLTRILLLGKPAFHPDEQFYLLVGERMARGALPYVDIWDRKPWGLFAIYRSVFWLPLDPIVTYQAMGLLCSVLVALVIERIARMIAPPPAARLAGAAYLLWGPVYNIALGQSPVFYNLPVALAALIVIEAGTRDKDPRLPWRGLAAMLLLGVAMQIKYSAVFEGVGLGLLLLMRAWKDAWSPWRIAAVGLAWIAMALLPTVLVTAWYIQHGFGDIYINANFLSVFTRSTGMKRSLEHLLADFAMLIPYGLAILVAPRYLRPVRGENQAGLPGLRFWALSSLFGFLVFGTWYDHYCGPMLVPFSVLAAPVFAREPKRDRWWARIMLIGGAIGTIIMTVNQVHVMGTARQMDVAVKAVSRELHGRCLYVFEGDSALYRLTNACLPTRYMFPSHLSLSKEAGAMNIDQVAEVHRIMGTRPGVVVTDVLYGRDKLNWPDYEAMRAELHQHYEAYAVVKLGKRHYRLWRLRAVDGASVAVSPVPISAPL